MKIVSVINYKGGVGKTTVVANIAAELAWRGQRVLLIDLDPQASLTFSFIDVDYWEQHYANARTIRNWYDAFIDQDQELTLSSLIVRPPRVNETLASSAYDGYLDIICSHLALINIDLELATRLGGASPRQNRNNFLRLHSRLIDGIESSEVQDNYDIVLIDCPPNFNIVTKTAIVACNRILIPAIPDYLSTLGISELERHILELVRNFNEYAEQADSPAFDSINPSIMGVIPMMVRVYANRPIRAQTGYIQRIGRDGFTVFDTFVRRIDTPYGPAPQYGVPVVLGSVEGTTRTVAEEEMESLTSEFLRRL